MQKEIQRCCVCKIAIKKTVRMNDTTDEFEGVYVCSRINCLDKFYCVLERVESKYRLDYDERMEMVVKICNGYDEFESEKSDEDSEDKEVENINKI